MQEIDPALTNRAESYRCFIDAPMPMVTLFKTLDVTKLVRIAKAGYSFNMLLCWCVGRAACAVPEFYLLPVGKKMMRYDALGVNVIVANRSGGINSCDLPLTESPAAFNRSYQMLTGQVAASCENYELDDCMIVGTSSLAAYDIDGAVNFYSGIFNNPFLIWGKYQKKWCRKLLKLSFQFHHVQMDGQQACRFLAGIQKEIDALTAADFKEHRGF